MSHTLRIIGYFTTWGTIYGLIIGILTGATGWIMGALFGAVFGTMTGFMLGIAVGLITALIHKLSFHVDIDIVVYRRRIVAFNGLLVGTVGLSVLIFLTTNVFRRPPRGTELADFYPLIATFIPKTVLLTALCVAYISSHYPDWIIRTFYSPDPPGKLYHAQKSFTMLLTRIGERSNTAIPWGLGMSFCLTEILSWDGITLSASNIIGQLFQAVVWSAMTMPLVILYLMVGNAVLLTFLKRVFFDEGVVEILTYHYKSVITIISFLFTVLMTNWYWVFGSIRMYLFNGFFSTPDNMHPVGKVAPIVLGLFMAFHVSKTLALPDSDKTKRKEKSHESAIA